MLYFNGDLFYVSVISLINIMNVLFKYYIDSIYFIKIINFFFLRLLNEFSWGIGYVIRGMGFMIVFCMLFGLVFLLMSFIIFLIKEKVIGVKYFQKVSGVSLYVYWMLNFVWDLLNYQVFILLIMVCFVVFQIQVYIGDSCFGFVYVMFFLYGWVCMFFVYIFYYVFKMFVFGMVVGSLFNIFIGMLFCIRLKVIYKFKYIKSGKLCNDILLIVKYLFNYLCFICYVLY